MVCEQNVNSVF